MNAGTVPSRLSFAPPPVTLHVFASARMHTLCGCSFYRRLSECNVCSDLFQEEAEKKSRNKDEDIIRPNYEIRTTRCPVIPLNKREGTI